MYVLVIYTEFDNELARILCTYHYTSTSIAYSHHTHHTSYHIIPHTKLIQKNNKQGERKLLSDVWGEVPPGEISEYSFCAIVRTI